MNFIEIRGQFLNLDLCYTIQITGWTKWSVYGSFIGHEFQEKLNENDFETREEAVEYIEKLTKKKGL
jgi:hypothetical protein